MLVNNIVCSCFSSFIKYSPLPPNCRVHQVADTALLALRSLSATGTHQESRSELMERSKQPAATHEVANQRLMFSDRDDSTSDRDSVENFSETLIESNLSRTNNEEQCLQRDLMPDFPRSGNRCEQTEQISADVSTSNESIIAHSDQRANQRVEPMHEEPKLFAANAFAQPNSTPTASSLIAGLMSSLTRRRSSLKVHAAADEVSKEGALATEEN